MRSAVDTAMADLRSISSGMQLPDLETLSAGEVAARAVRDYERKTGAGVAWTLQGEPVAATLPLKIAVYRVLQELLANGFRHAGGAGQRVDVAQGPDEIVLEVGDSGPGFDVARETRADGGGLAGMRERVAVLGGTFDVHSVPGAGNARARPAADAPRRRTTMPDAIAVARRRRSPDLSRGRRPCAVARAGHRGRRRSGVGRGSARASRAS